MEIYALLLVSTIIGCLLDFYNIKRSSQIFFFINFLSLFFVSVLRYNLGSDYATYESMFQESIKLFYLSLDYFIYNNNSIEWGYLLFESVVKTFTDSFFIFIVIYNIIIFYFIWKSINYINKFKNIQIFIILCFIFPLYIIEAHRQAMAMVIFFYNIKNIIEKKFFSYVFWVFISFIFHKVSIILLPVYFFANKEYAKKSIFFIYILTVVISIFDLTGKIILYLDYYFGYISLVKRVYVYYFLKNSPSVSDISYLIRIFLLCLFFLFYRKVDYRIVNLVIFYILIFFLFSSIGVLSGRISAMFLVSYIYYFTYLLSNIRYNLNKVLIFLFILLYGSIIYYKDITMLHPVYGHEIFTPYKTIFEKYK